MGNMTGKCESFREDLVALAGSREPIPKEPRAHLEACSVCRAEWESFEKDWDLLGNDSVDAGPGNGFVKGVRGRLFNQNRRRVFVAGLLAASVLLGVVVVMVMSGGHEEKGMETAEKGIPVAQQGRPGTSRKPGDAQQPRPSDGDGRVGGGKGDGGTMNHRLILLVLAGLALAFACPRHIEALEDGCFLLPLFNTPDRVNP